MQDSEAGPVAEPPGVAAADDKGPPPDGRRRALVEVVGLVVVFAAWSAAVGAGSPATLVGASPAATLVMAVLANGVVLLGFIAIALRLSGQPLTSLGLGRVPLREAVYWGPAGLVACYVANVMVVGVHVAWRALAGDDILSMATGKLDAVRPLTAIPSVLVVPIALFVGFYEEVVFRGFLLSRLRALLATRRLPVSLVAGVAVVVSALAFGLAHAYQGGLGVAQTLAVGVVLGSLAVWRRNIWCCIAAHLGIDVLGLFVLKFLAGLLGTLHGAAIP